MLVLLGVGESTVPLLQVATGLYFSARILLPRAGCLTWRPPHRCSRLRIRDRLEEEESRGQRSYTAVLTELFCLLTVFNHEVCLCP